jgi:2,5-dihydroxypyridine 5,6-dioxygenase
VSVAERADANVRAMKERLRHPGWCDNLVRAGRLQPGERVLVVVDEPLVEEGSQLAAAVADAGGQPRLELWTGRRPLSSPPVPVLEAASETDLSLFLSQAPHGEEGGARMKLLERVTEHGGRQIFLGFVDGELLRGELSTPSVDLQDPALRLLSQLERASELRVRGRAGTDLTVRIDGRPWRSDALPLRPGNTANYPGGEVFVCPLEDSANGVVVADLTVPYTVEGLVDEPVVMRFEAGRVTAIDGGEAAQLLRELVDRAGAGADVIAELGIGFNPTVSPRGHVMLDEKAAGTAHVAIGRNTGPYGGVNEATIHVDCVFSHPEIAADGHPVELP